MKNKWEAYLTRMGFVASIISLLIFAQFSIDVMKQYLPLIERIIERAL